MGWFDWFRRKTTKRRITRPAPSTWSGNAGSHDVLYDPTNLLSPLNPLHQGHAGPGPSYTAPDPGPPAADYSGGTTPDWSAGGSFDGGCQDTGSCGSGGDF
jgi:hypothetical protein